MNKIAKFEKVSYEQFKKDFINTVGELSEDSIRETYNNIKLPQRATTGSAGYDFFIPYPAYIAENWFAVIPTGIRCKIEDGWVLNIYPRSGLGFKNKLHLYNTVGIIDSDYYYSDNEGHIMVKFEVGHKTTLDNGKAFVQGVFTPYGITIDDNATEIRNGGFGSTDERI